MPPGPSTKSVPGSGPRRIQQFTETLTAELNQLALRQAWPWHKWLAARLLQTRWKRKLAQIRQQAADTIRPSSDMPPSTEIDAIFDTYVAGRPDDATAGPAGGGLRRRAARGGELGLTRQLASRARPGRPRFRLHQHGRLLAPSPRLPEDAPRGRGQRQAPDLATDPRVVGPGAPARPWAAPERARGRRDGQRGRLEPGPPVPRGGLPGGGVLPGRARRNEQACHRDHDVD